MSPFSYFLIITFFVTFFEKFNNENLTISLEKISSEESTIIYPFAHSDYVTDLSFSPNGEYLASSSADETVKIWEVKSGKLLRNLHQQTYLPEKLFFDRDSKKVAVLADKRKILIWDIQEDTLLYIHENVRFFSNTGKYAITSNAEHGLAISKTFSNQRILKNIHLKSYNIFSNQDSFMVSFDPYKEEILIINLEREELNKIVLNSKPYLLAIDDSGGNLVVAFKESQTKLIKINSLDTSRIQGQPLPIEQNLLLKTIKFSPNGQFLALVTARDNSLFTYHVDDLSLIFHEQDLRVGNIEFDKSSRQLVFFVFAPRGKTERETWFLPLTKRSDGKKKISNSGNKFALSPNVEYLANGFDNGVIRVREIETVKTVFEVKNELGEPYAMGIDPQGKYIYAGYNKFFQIDSSKFVRITQITNLEDDIPYRFCPKWKYAIDGIEQIYDIQTGKKVYALPKLDEYIQYRHEHRIFSPQGNFILAVDNSKEHKMIVVENATGKVIFSRNFDTDPNHLAFSPNENLVSVGNYDGIEVYNIKKNQLLFKNQLNIGRVYRTSFSPSGKYIVAHAYLRNRRHIFIWDLQTQKLVLQRQGGDRESYRFYFSEFLDNEKSILWASADREFELITFPEGKVIYSINSMSPLKEAVISPNKKFMITADIGFFIKFWDISKGKELCRLAFFYKTHDYYIEAPEKNLINCSPSVVNSMYILNEFEIISDSLYLNAEVSKNKYILPKILDSL